MPGPICIVKKVRAAAFASHYLATHNLQGKKRFVWDKMLHSKSRGFLLNFTIQDIVDILNRVQGTAERRNTRRIWRLSPVPNEQVSLSANHPTLQHLCREKQDRLCVRCGMEAA